MDFEEAKKFPVCQSLLEKHEPITSAKPLMGMLHNSVLAQMGSVRQCGEYQRIQTPFLQSRLAFRFLQSIPFSFPTLSSDDFFSYRPTRQSLDNLSYHPCLCSFTHHKYLQVIPEGYIQLNQCSDILLVWIF